MKQQLNIHTQGGFVVIQTRFLGALYGGGGGGGKYVGIST